VQGLQVADTPRGLLPLRLTDCWHVCIGVFRPVLCAGSDLWMGNPLGMAAGSRGGAGASLSQGKLLDAAAAAAGLGEASSSSAGLHTELLPAGCAPDAYKLFVGNVPKTFTEEDLRPVSVLGGVGAGEGGGPATWGCDRRRTATAGAGAPASCISCHAKTLARCACAEV
jgi:hypothetical protein